MVGRRTRASHTPVRPVSAPSCHGPGDATAPEGSPTVALVGSPNVGKSTLFTMVTRSQAVVGNWPGTTVEVTRGVWDLGPGRQATVVDLPGAYSLDPMSPDEQFTRDVLTDPDHPESPDVVLVATDAAHLSRSLYLVSQVRELALRVIVVLTMGDVAERRGEHVDTDALASAIGCPVVSVNARRRIGAADLTTTVNRTLALPPLLPRRRLDEHATFGADDGVEVDLDDDLAAADERFAWVEQAVAAARTHDGRTRRSVTDVVDRWTTAPVVGPLIFLALMWAVFVATTTVAAPLQDLLDAFFTGPVSSAASWLLRAVGLEGTWVVGLVVDGLVGGVGMLLTFVPLMAIMFLLLSLLEDSGYMARAAVVTDRLMSRIGLPGRAFLPLVVGFGCNVPAISATRILPQARHRIMTALLVPFTSCSARLTVYVLMAATFFPDHAGTVVFAMYVVSILLVVVVGLAMKQTLWRRMGADPLVIDLPPYQRPTWRVTTSVTWTRLLGFLRTAGGVIVATVTVVWLLQNVPVDGGSFGHVAVENSLYAVLAQAIAPVFTWSGFAQWQTASALIVGFIAKEAVISSWGQTYAISAQGHGGDTPLRDAIHQAFVASSDRHPTAAAAAFMVFLLAYTPCVATLAAQKREIGLRWTVVGLLTQLAVAWTLSVVVFQVGSRL